jgi:hypothetical protein
MHAGNSETVTANTSMKVIVKRCSTRTHDGLNDIPEFSTQPAATRLERLVVLAPCTNLSASLSFRAWDKGSACAKELKHDAATAQDIAHRDVVWAWALGRAFLLALAWLLYTHPGFNLFLEV